eukprot:3716172-Pleurochrysis_carterae.AAC.1
MLPVVLRAVLIGVSTVGYGWTGVLIADTQCAEEPTVCCLQSCASSDVAWIAQLRRRGDVRM